jgi:hypothetical protein
MSGRVNRRNARAARWAATWAFTCVIAFAGAFSCGDVPTLDDGIAYISPIILPSPAVAAGDTLRDSLGNAAPLRVMAFDQQDAALPDPVATFLPTSVPAPISISEDGIVTAADTVSAAQTVQLVARVGGRLQTTTASLLVVSQPDLIAQNSAEVLETALPALDTLRVLVTGLNSRKIRVVVPGIIVRYRIAAVYPSATASGTAMLTLEGRTISRPDSLAAVDTTDPSGVAARTLVVAGTGIDSVVVFAQARSLKNMPLRGDSVHFVLRVKH